MEFITIESHFWVPENAIRPDTRNKCSKDLVAIIYRVAEILYPDEKIEVLLLPSEEGSYKDIFKITWSVALWLATISGTVISYLMYKDSHEEHAINIASQCINLQSSIKQSSTLDDEYIVNEDKLLEICKDHGIKKMKNERYITLEKDDMIQEEETIIKDARNQTLFQGKVERADFSSYIQYLPENENYLQENIDWVIELVSLVIKQEKKWKGIPWRGFYYGKPIQYWWIEVLVNNEIINFFMQDNDFKKKIDDHTITFTSWDNITVIFDLKWEIKGWIIQHKSIYVRKVENFNDVVIDHTVKKNNSKYKSQGLFENYDI